MKKLFTLLALLTWGLSFAKKIEYWQFNDKYDGTRVTWAAILPDFYDPSKEYVTLIAEGGDGEKIMGGSTLVNVQGLLKKTGQAGCEYLKTPKDYGILVTFIVPYQPSELVVNGVKTLLKGRLLTQVIEQAKSKYKVSKISLTGLSSGGADVWQYISAYPNSFYAAVPMACWQYTQTSALNKAVATGGGKIWQIQNSDDGRIGITSDENLSYFMNDLIKQGIDGKMTVLNKTGHDTWISVYQLKQLPYLTSNANMSNLSAPPSDVWAYLFGNDGISKPDTVATPIPFPVENDTAKGKGLKVVYGYSSKTVSNGIVSQCTNTYTGILDTLNKSSNIPPVAGFPVTNWQMIATGSILFPYASAWEIKVGSDDGNTLMVGGDTISNDWKDHAYKETSKAKQLNAGRLPISFAYYNACCAWRYSIYWRPNAWSNWEVIPTKYLYDK